METTTEMALPEGVARVGQVLHTQGHLHPPRMLQVAARTAQEAADALGVQLGQIAKSIIFKRRADGMPVLVVASGDRRVDPDKVAALVGPVGRADADYVKAQTGFSIGGVSPVGHINPVLTLVDEDLFRFDDIWAAAGHPNAVFLLSPDQLCALVQVMASDVAAAPLPDMPPAARKLLSDRAATVTATGSTFLSPCVGVCRMDAVHDYCLGCLRTRAELTQWSTAEDDQRLAIWHRIDQRLQGKLT